MGEFCVCVKRRREQEGTEDVRGGGGGELTRWWVGGLNLEREKAREALTSNIIPGTAVLYIGGLWLVQ